MNSVAVVTPTHKDNLDLVEILRLRKTLATLASSSHFFLVPQTLDSCKLRKLFVDSQFLRMPDWFFRSVEHYNILMLQEVLYKRFLNFEFILVCQSDAFVIGDIGKLLAYDYFGASWTKDYKITELFGQIFVNRPSGPLGKVTTVSAGNGGLSLRNVNCILEIISLGKSKSYWSQFERLRKRKLNEDVVISFLAKKYGLKIPGRLEANRFFVETNSFDPNALGELIGFHALEKYQPGLEQLVFQRLDMDSTI